MALKVLLAEDNQDNQDLMRFLLERNGYEVVTALNGRLAIELARRECPDVVLMDLTMPEMNGWEAAAAIKTDPVLAHIPLIAVTAHSLPDDRRKTLAAGFDHYISKPINIRLFDSIVSQALGRSETQP